MHSPAVPSLVRRGARYVSTTWQRLQTTRSPVRTLRAVAAEIVDILIPVDIPLVRALRPIDIDGMRREIAADMGNSVGQGVPGLLMKRLGAGCLFGVRAEDLGVRDWHGRCSHATYTIAVSRKPCRMP